MDTRSRLIGIDAFPIDLIRIIESYLAFWDVRTISNYSARFNEKEYFDFATNLFILSQNRIDQEWKRIIEYFLINIADQPSLNSIKITSYTEAFYKKIAEAANPKCEKSLRFFHNSLQKATAETNLDEEKSKNNFFDSLYKQDSPLRLGFFILALRQQKEANRELSRILQSEEFYAISDLPAVVILRCCFILGMTPTEFFEERETTDSRLVTMAVQNSNACYFRDISTLLISPIQPFTPHFSVLNLLGQVLWYTVWYTVKTSVSLRKQGIIDILNLAGGPLEIKQALFEFYAQINYIRTLQNSPYANNHRHILAPSYVTNIKHLSLDHPHLRIPNQELIKMEALADEMLSPLYEKIVHHSDKTLTEDEKKQDIAITIKKIHAINNFQALEQQWEICMSRPTLHQQTTRFEYNKSKQAIIQAFQERAFALLLLDENKKDPTNITIKTIEQCKNLLRGPLFGEERLNHFNKNQTDHELGGVPPIVRRNLEKKLFESLQQLSLQGELSKFPAFKKLSENFQTRYDLSMVKAPEKVISAVDEIIQSRIIYWVFEFPLSNRCNSALTYDDPRSSYAPSSSSSSRASSSSASLSLAHSVSFPTSSNTLTKPSAPPAFLMTPSFEPTTPSAPSL